MRVKLNVGGVIYETTSETLTINSEYFNSLFKHDYEKYFNKKGEQINEIFIDRSGKDFKYVLKLMRNPNSKIPKIYMEELIFYGIEYNTELPNYEDIEEYRKEKSYLKLTEKEKVKYEELMNNYMELLDESIIDYDSECIILILQEKYVENKKNEFTKPNIKINKLINKVLIDFILYLKKKGYNNIKIINYETYFNKEEYIKYLNSNTDNFCINKFYEYRKTLHIELLDITSTNIN